MSDVSTAIRTALRVDREQREKLRAALEAGDIAAVIRWARREAGLDEEMDAEGDSARAREQRGASRS